MEILGFGFPAWFYSFRVILGDGGFVREDKKENNQQNNNDKDNNSNGFQRFFHDSSSLQLSLLDSASTRPAHSSSSVRVISPFCRPARIPSTSSVPPGMIMSLPAFTHRAELEAP